MTRRTVELPVALRPEDIVVLQDSREQAPWCLDPLRVKVTSLPTADYSISGLETMVAIERKSLPDLAACCGSSRERFERELDRLRAYPSRCVVVEADWSMIKAGGWPGMVSPSCVLSSIASWSAKGIPFALCGDRAGAQDFAKRFLLAVARHSHERLKAFAATFAASEIAVEAF